MVSNIFSLSKNFLNITKYFGNTFWKPFHAKFSKFRILWKLEKCQSLMCDLVSFIQMFQYVSPQLFWQGTICLFIYLYCFSYNNVSVNLKPNVMVCAFLFRLKWNEMFLIEMMIIFNRNELLNTVDRHCAWLDHFL